MMNKINIQKTWDRVFSAAEKIKEMKPWEWMAETDIFGIRIPETERIYFISVMGSAGEVTEKVRSFVSYAFDCSSVSRFAFGRSAIRFPIAGADL